MTVFALQVRVGRLDNVHCSVGGGGRGGGAASLWISVLLIFTLLASNVGAALSPDGQALLRFLEANSDLLDPSLGFASWNASDDTPCEWLRVFCGLDSAVRRLDLSACSLPTPAFNFWWPVLSQLSDIESLQALDLSYNPNVVFSSRELQSLAGLTWLDLSRSASIYEIDYVAFPSLQYLKAEETFSHELLYGVLHKLPELVALSLANNGESGVIPEGVRHLTQLKILDLSNNSFEGSIPNLEGLTRLVQLSVARNNLSGDVPTAPSLQILDAAENLFTDLTDSFFLQNSALKQVNFSWNQLVGQLPGNIGGHKFLQVLDLSWNCLQGQIPSGLEKVTHLDLSHNNLSGLIPGTLPPTLRVLDLSHNNLTGAIPGNLFFGLPYLEYIDLSGNDLSGTIPDGLNLTVFKAGSFAGNPGLCGGPLLPCKAPHDQPPRSRFNVLLLVTVVVAAVWVSTGSCLLLVWRWRVYSIKHQQDADLIAPLLEREP